MHSRREVASGGDGIFYGARFCFVRFCFCIGKNCWNF